MGQVVAPYGVKGWLKIRPASEQIGALLDHDPWYVAARDAAQSPRPMHLLDGHRHGATLVAQLEGIEDRDQAERYVGATVAVPRSELPRPAADEFYWVDLVGAEVVNLQGVHLGSVAGLLETGAHAVLQVRDGEERLIPFVDVYVREVDLARKRIVVDWQPDY